MEINLLLKIVDHYDNGLPFVVYSEPESSTATVYFQKDAVLHTTNNFTEAGFIFAPFDFMDSAIYIPEEENNVFQFNIENNATEVSLVNNSGSNSDKERYIELISKTLKVIKQQKTTKIVVSRYEDISINRFEVKTLIEQLFSSNFSAFRYIWYHSKTGLWCGATPEVLVKITGNSFTTMALAGTKQYNESKAVHWTSKEIDEQQLVTDSITNCLQRVTSVLKVSNAYTHRAGSLLHLRTDITGILKNRKTTLSTIAAALHPTPAVCGSPQRFAKKYILENEGYSREYYTGFMGPINTENTPSTLMVNLRCLRIENNIARIFVGGGITLGSNPQDEWQETQNKMQTMLQVLQPML